MNSGGGAAAGEIRGCADYISDSKREGGADLDRISSGDRMVRVRRTPSECDGVDANAGGV